MTPMTEAAPLGYEDALVAEVATYYANPLGFVRAMYPWGQPGTELAHEEGPDAWQAALLSEIGAHVTAQKFDGQAPVKPFRAATT